MLKGKQVELRDFVEVEIIKARELRKTANICERLSIPTAGKLHSSWELRNMDSYIIHAGHQLQWR